MGHSVKSSNVTPRTYAFSAESTSKSLLQALPERSCLFTAGVFNQITFQTKQRSFVILRPIVPGEDEGHFYEMNELTTKFLRTKNSKQVPLFCIASASICDHLVSPNHVCNQMIKWLSHLLHCSGAPSQRSILLLHLHFQVITLWPLFLPLQVNIGHIPL